MKSKKIRRLVSVVLVLVLATQFVFAASAEGNTGTADWRDADGYKWTAVVAKTGDATRTTVVHSAAVIHEGYWADGDTPFVSGYYTVSYSVNFNFPSTYRAKLYEAADQIDMNESYSEYIHLSANGFKVPYYEDYGSYSPTTTILGNTGVYRVEVVRELETVPVQPTTTIPFAPRDCSGVMTGYTIM